MIANNHKIKYSYHLIEVKKKKKVVKKIQQIKQIIVQIIFTHAEISQRSPRNNLFPLYNTSNLKKILWIKILIKIRLNNYHNQVFIFFYFLEL